MLRDLAENLFVFMFYFLRIFHSPLYTTLYQWKYQWTWSTGPRFGQFSPSRHKKG